MCKFYIKILIFIAFGFSSGDMRIEVKYSSNCSLVCGAVFKSHWHVYRTVAIATYHIYI